MVLKFEYQKRSRIGIELIGNIEIEKGEETRQREEKSLTGKTDHTLRASEEYIKERREKEGRKPAALTRMAKK